MFSPGDIVRIKSKEFLIKHKNEEPTVVSKMLEYAEGIFEVDNVVFGELITLCGVFDHSDGIHWHWKEEWLEPYVELKAHADILVNLLEG